MKLDKWEKNTNKIKIEKVGVTRLRRVEGVIESGFVEIMARRVPENVVLRNIIDENYCPSRFKVHERLNDFALIVSGENSSEKFRGKTRRNEISRPENIEREERRVDRILSALSTFEISRLLRVKEGEHFFFFRKLRYSVFSRMYYYIHARSQIIEWKSVDRVFAA